MNAVYERTYNYYMSQFDNIDLKSIRQKLGVTVDKDEITIPLFGKPHKVSKDGVADPSGEKPALYICIILCKYLLMCPDVSPKGKEWATFRDLKDSGPLETYFANDIERPIADMFKGRLDHMNKACKALGGYPSDLEVNYDLAIQFDALPKVPVLILYNDADDEFGAKCSLLFDKFAEIYLDPECLAMDIFIRI